MKKIFNHLYGQGAHNLYFGIGYAVAAVFAVAFNPTLAIAFMVLGFLRLTAAALESQWKE